MERSSGGSSSSLNPPDPLQLQGQSNPLCLLPLAGERIAWPVGARELTGRGSLRRSPSLLWPVGDWESPPHLASRWLPVNGGEQGTGAPDDCAGPRSPRSAVGSRSSNPHGDRWRPWPSASDLEAITSLRLPIQHRKTWARCWKPPAVGSTEPYSPSARRPCALPKLKRSNRRAKCCAGSAPGPAGNDQLGAWERRRAAAHSRKIESRRAGGLPPRAAS